MNIRGTRFFSLAIALGLLCALCFASCSRMGESSLKLPANPVLSGGLGWAVVKDAYVRLKEAPSDSSMDLDHLRRGAVYRLDSRDLGAAEEGPRDRGSASGKNKNRGIWYGIQSESAKGWVSEGELDIYGSQSQAEKAAAAYR